MNKYFVLLIGLVFGCTILLAQNLSIDYQLSYTDNAFSLSKQDLDKFDANQGFSYIETSDDIIQTINLRFSNSYRNKDYRITPAISLTNDVYLNNSDKNKLNLLAGFNSRVYKTFIDFRYGWYPNNYTQKYLDTDGTNKYEKFEYDKNLYKLTVKYPITKRLDVELYGKYEGYYHNKYFTEYDGDALTTGLGLFSKYQPGTLSVFYYFKQFDNNSDNAYNQRIIDTERDCSYDSDAFEVEYTFPRLYTNYVDYSPFLGFRIENSIYQSKHSLESDPIHASREDTVIKVNAGTTIYVFKNINFKLDAIQAFRRVSSNNENLKRLKNYDKLQICAGVNYLFDFK
ncbi:MAG TPA: hypothetical protein PKZ69_02685 [Candidatus Cloacimonadota bacterium]|nr:hypothetical protein [Candidatus Cloacimonadota bacterium]HPK40503.1 hypothetical protein [Candidatus Cloacimonadota bacterium]